mmetsp:Transcript_14448/g.23902  ORF Transcript_14448/g.23902 Transcript_14448/m.23902 type:complete len:246 (+) Transcript_14448:400-1137(+)
MLALGLYGILRALHKRRRLSSSSTNDNNNEDEPLNQHQPLASSTNDVEAVELAASGAEASLSMADVGDVAAPISQGATTAAAIPNTAMGSSDDESFEEQVSQYKTSLDASMHRLADQQADADSQQQENNQKKSSSIWNNCSTGVVALAAGLVHGLAGPGGVLGVIPAVQIRDPWLGSLYLGTFCITSTLTMGCFAIVYGTVSKKLGQSCAKWEFRIECASASLSVLVGLLWLVLLATGKLEDVFG